ncbi:hypothetical protein J4E91_001339 [Alternaria rosae]|nr:hypothetical protein J4E91_001339 [Alternaria rosae]
MVRTRACKARPRPPSRNTIIRVTSGRGSTVESLRASTISVEYDTDKRDYLRNIDVEDSTVKIKQEEEDTTETNDTRISPKRRAQEMTPKSSIAKKHKSSPPASATRLTRSKTLPYRNEASRTQFDSESESSESDIETRLHTKLRSINSPLHLLRPYMAFQLSVSGLSGKAYNAAQASMKSVLDVAESFEKQCGGTSTGSGSISSSTTTSEIATEIASDTEDEAKYPPVKQPSVSSTTSIYDSLCASTTDFDQTSSEGEESDVIERRDKNALRRQKARQKKRNAWKREQLESESEVETGVGVIEETEEEKTPMLTEIDCGREVMVDFCPVAW